MIELLIEPTSSRGSYNVSFGSRTNARPRAHTEDYLHQKGNCRAQIYIQSVAWNLNALMDTQT